MNDTTFHPLIKKLAFLVLMCTMPLAMATPFLSDRHVQLGLTCAGCHLENPPSKEVPTEQCQTCHGDYDKLALLTEKTLPHNPHASHYGEPECHECHKGHQPSVLLCNDCHSYSMTVP